MSPKEANGTPHSPAAVSKPISSIARQKGFRKDTTKRATNGA
ncbi:hypothetical protein FOXYSP1_17110 [Fusarium oxysporum f. sp. phaseoli]